jgi:hypothetical protein
LFRGRDFLFELLLFDALHQLFSLAVFEALRGLRAGLHERSLPQSRLCCKAASEWSHVAYQKLLRPTYPWGVSNLRRADYTQHLAGKTVLRVTWHNESDEDYRCLSIFFTDETMVSFRFHTFVDEEAELADFIGGNLSGERLIRPAPITRPAKDGE